MYWDTKKCVTLVELVLICTTILLIRVEDSRVEFLFLNIVNCDIQDPLPLHPSHSLSKTVLVTKQIKGQDISRPLAPIISQFAVS